MCMSLCVSTVGRMNHGDFELNHSQTEQINSTRFFEVNTKRQGCGILKKQNKYFSLPPRTSPRAPSCPFPHLSLGAIEDATGAAATDFRRNPPSVPKRYNNDCGD